MPHVKHALYENEFVPKSSHTVPYVPIPFPYSYPGFPISESVPKPFPNLSLDELERWELSQTYSHTVLPAREIPISVPK